MAARLKPETGHILNAGGSPAELGVVCTPGFEQITRAEIEALGIPVNLVEPGLITVQGRDADVYRLNYQLRTASRVLVRLGAFNAAAFSELHKKAARLNWRKFLLTGRPVTVRVSTHGSKLYHKKGIAERVVKAIGESIGGTVTPVVVNDEEAVSDAQLIVVRLLRNMCAISVDSSGEHLHRRGYRQAVGKAPLRETLAAGLVLASGWDRMAPLADPCCGSGTILIEAAMMAAGIAPGQQRSFAFQAWPCFDAGAWAAVAAERRAPPIQPVLAGSDRDEGVIRMATENAARAGVETMITFSRRSISDFQAAPSPGWIITNPPYGERVKGGRDLRDLYARMGRVFRERAAGWHIYMISASPRWTGQMGLTAEPVVKFNNGGLPVSLVRLG